MMLSVHEVNKVIDNKRKDKFAIFETISEKCHKYIVKYAKNERYRCFFEVPEFILGTPIYNLNAAIMYLMNKLSKNGYLVKYFFPNYLYISWSLDEISGKKIEIARPVQIQSRPAQTQITFPNGGALYPPKPVATRNVNRPDQGVLMPHTPSFDIQPPQSTFGRNSGMNHNSKNFIKSISDYKPSGKFVLDLS